MGTDSRLALLWTTLAVFFAATGTATATDRYAVALGGVSPAGGCTTAMPCELQAAINASAPDDTISLAGGTYTDPDGDGFEVDRRLTLEGGDGARAVIQSTKSGQPALDLVAGVADGTALLYLEVRGPVDAFAIDGFDNNDTVNRAFDVRSVALDDVRIDTLGSCIRTGIGFASDLHFRTSSRVSNTDCADFNGDSGSPTSPSKLENLTVEAPLDGQVRGAVLTGNITSVDVRITTGGVGAQILNGVHRRWNVTGGTFGVTLQRFAFLTPADAQPKTTFTDSVVRATHDAVFVLAGRPTIRNVTAVGGQRGVVADGADSIFDGADPILVNVIARGASPADDLDFEPNECQPNDPFPPQCVPAEGRMSASYTNARTPASSRIALGGGIQTENPFCAAGDDLHLPGSSPARNSGLNSAVTPDPDISGSAAVDKDADGDARIQDAVVDIGGDEAPSTVPCSPPTTDNSQPPTTPSAPTDTQQPPAIADTTRPTFTATLSARTFRVGSTATALSAAKPKGTKVKVKSLSEAATMRFRVLQKVAGRRSGKKCVAQTRRNATQRKCTRTVDRGSFTRKLAAGNSTTGFSGRLKGSNGLARGSYTLELRATDAAGNASVTRTLAFKIVKG